MTVHVPPVEIAAAQRTFVQAEVFFLCLKEFWNFVEDIVFENFRDYTFGILQPYLELRHTVEVDQIGNANVGQFSYSVGDSSVSDIPAREVPGVSAL